MFSKKYFFLGLFSGIILLILFVFSLPDRRLHLVFCDVGQGDAVYIRTPKNKDILIDGGPDKKVLLCLGKYMPLFDRTIDMVLLSHPQKDHLEGLIFVLERYQVKYFVSGVEGNETEGYKKLLELIRQKNIPVKNLYAGDEFFLGEVKFSVLWPEKKWVAEKIKNSSLNASDLNRDILGLSADGDLNDFSYVLNLSYGYFSALFPGDADSRIQPEIIRTGNLRKVNVLKFPHHGAKTAVVFEFLAALKPELAVISVGYNSYGHPSEEALELLKKFSVKIKRTDLRGNIEIVSDGRSYWVN